LIASHIGLRFPRERWSDLERGVGSAAGELGFSDAGACIRSLLSSPLTRRRIEILASHLTIGETYFFREKRSLAVLEESILPALIRARQSGERSLRIWSAGCCTGEEPYSIAILLDKLIPDLQNWNITILATDINPRFLQKASEGLYTEWSFRDSPASIKERYFERKKGGRFQILPEIKKRVTFSYLNLAEEADPSSTNNTDAMDLILCRNVLMYFAPERAEKVVDRFYRSLIDGGWLIVSPCETSQGLFAPFTTINLPEVILYRKESDRPRTAPSPEAFLPMPAEAPAEDLFTQETGAFLPLEDQKRRPAEAGPAPCAEAAALYERGRYSEASEKIAGLLKDDPGNAKAMTLMARIYANQGDLAEALQWCERAIAADKLAAGGHYLLATVLQERGQAAEAILSLKRALYLAPDFALAHFTLGNLTRQLGKPKESEKHYANALSFLNAHRSDELLPEADGITAGRLIEIIRSTTLKEKAR
jgi:chemotaxis protein methyltransferase CheR